MTIEVTSLDELDSTELSAFADEQASLLQARFPDLDPGRGVERRVLLHPSSALALKSQTEMDRMRRSMSPKLAAEDPNLADEDILDNAAGNFRADRFPGSAAEGSIVIVVSRLDPLLIPVGFQVEARGLTFVTEEPFSIRTDESGVTSSTDRVLNPTSDGNWSFSVPVTCTSVGENGRLLRSEAVVPTVPPGNFVKAYAASDFAGGVDEDTNAILLEKLRDTVAAQSMSDRVSMNATLQRFYPETVDASVIGAGDAEMLRDQHSIFPGSSGGCVDWYIRTSQLPIRKLLQKTATLISIAQDGSSIWQVGIGRDEAPGFYDVWQITLPDADVTGGYEVTSDMRGKDLQELDSGAPIPDILSIDEVAYSRFQTAVLQFHDTDTDTDGLIAGSTTADYDVVVRHFPNLADIQDLLGGRERGGTAGDILIKAPVPAFLTLSIDIRSPETAATIDQDALSRDLLTTVNTTPIGSPLAGSVLLDVIHRYLPVGAFVRNLDMLVRIRTPGGENVWTRSSEVIEIPDRSAEMVSPRTTVFLLEPEAIAVSVAVLAQPNV